MSNFEAAQNQNPNYPAQEAPTMKTALEDVATATQPPNDTQQSAGKKNKGGRPRKENKPTPWSIKGVDAEARAIVTKAAERAGKTLGEYMSNEVREYASGQLKRGQQPPASPQDVAEMVKADVQAMELRLSTQSTEQMAALRRDILASRKGFFSRLFG